MDRAPQFFDAFAEPDKLFLGDAVVLRIACLNIGFLEFFEARAVGFQFARPGIDEAHVDASRAQYQQKFRDADRIFAGLQGYQAPGGGFFLWLPVEDGEAAALKLWRETGVRVLPGGYLSRDAGGQNPGRGYIRVALVAPQEETQRGLTLLRDCIYG